MLQQNEQTFQHLKACNESLYVQKENGTVEQN